MKIRPCTVLLPVPLLLLESPFRGARAVFSGVLALTFFGVFALVVTPPAVHLLQSLGAPTRIPPGGAGGTTFPEASYFALACAAFGIGFLNLALRPGCPAVWDRAAGQLWRGRQVVDVGGVSAIAVREVEGEASRWDVLALLPDERRVRVGFCGVERDAYDAAGRMASFLSVPVVTYQGSRGS